MIPLLSLTPLYVDNKQMLLNIIGFLNSRPDGRLYKWKDINRKILEWYGYDNSTIRKYWVSTTDKVFTPNQKLVLAKYMDHSVDTQLKHYNKI